MSKHTPAPWLMDRNDCHVGGMATIHHCIGNDWIEIWTDTWCTEGCELTEERMEANAMLMLAAPEMLAALEAVVSVADRATQEFDMARAAIAKARGKP